MTRLLLTLSLVGAVVGGGLVGCYRGGEIVCTSPEGVVLYQGWYDKETDEAFIQYHGSFFNNGTTVYSKSVCKKVQP